MKRASIVLALMVFAAAGWGVLSVVPGSAAGIDVAAGAGQAVPGPGPTAPVDVYAAKFLCGPFGIGVPPSQEGPAKPGDYRTAINVHNPNNRPVALTKRAVLLFRSDVPPRGHEIPSPPGPSVLIDLDPGWGFEIDCPDIREVLLQNQVPHQAFIKGFVVIETRGDVLRKSVTEPPPLHVVPAYTAHGFNPDPAGGLRPEGFALDVERVIPSRKVF